MKAVIMAGGKASRFGKGSEKALITLAGKNLLEISLDKLKDHRISEVFVSVSANTPKTLDFCKSNEVPSIMTSGADYHRDIYELLDELGNFISLNVDCPFVTSENIASLIQAAKDVSISTVVRKDAVPFTVDGQSVFKADNGMEYVWLGLNYVTLSKTTELIQSDNWLGALNINTAADLELAKRYIGYLERLD